MFSKVKIFSLFAILSISLAGCKKEELNPYQGQASAEIDGSFIEFNNLGWISMGLSQNDVSQFDGFNFNSFNSATNISYGSLDIYLDKNIKPELNKPYPITTTEENATYCSVFDRSPLARALSQRSNPTQKYVECFSPIVFTKEVSNNASLPEIWRAGQSKIDNTTGYVVYTKISDTAIEGKFECTLFSRYVVKEGDTLNLAPKKVKNGKFSVRRK